MIGAIRMWIAAGLACMSPAVTAQLATYDGNTGLLVLPVVQVGGATYVNVTLLNTGNFTFKLQTAAEQVPPGSTTVTYDGATGLLSIPVVTVGDSAYTNVTLRNLGDYTFTLLTATEHPGPIIAEVAAVPTDRIVGLNGLLRLTTAAAGSGPLAYQWRRNGSPIDGATGSSLEQVMGVADQGASFDVVVTNAAGSVISDAQAVKVIFAPAPTDVLPSCHISLPMPSTGAEAPALAAIEDAVRGYMVARSTPAATVVVRRLGVVLMERGYGWQDLTCTRPMPFSGLLRSASIAKPVTAAVVYNLVAAGQLSWTDRAFCVTGSPANCILDFTGVTPADARVRDITVQHLLEHRAGWDIAAIGDPMFQQVQIAQSLGVASPPSKRDIASFVLANRPLQSAPGAVYSYLSFGYLVLGLIIEQRTGKAFIDYTQQALFAPLGIAASDAQGMRSLPAGRNPREPWYSDPRALGSVNVFDPAGPRVKFPDGGYAGERFDAHGGWLFSARAYSRFLADYWISGKLRDATNQFWFFYGSIPGTLTLAYQRGDVDIVVLTNQRRADVGGPDDYELHSLLDKAVANISNWPATPPPGHDP